ncbi:hypothetical protein DTO027B5_8130 [Paecilomyces variotii]|nr:hypothetical protein DTO169C6_779 [Paecilomyces variotii]KAJ9286356.1 hypothetical protein DTO021C3_6066 [Paecilomyces variotii]KAJ9319896.1 hypothetical protein DTO027B3_9099 [Paecilomyces variotii]KAJ9330065.1 hypothetical protein DTO027B5_8130 [Paecilomyces variotii]
MANGKAVVARIPNPNAGPAFLTTASEVATMDFLRNMLCLPVPEVLAWNSAVDSTNRVGAEYIIMEHAPGKNLADVWTDMDLEPKVQIMEDIVAIQHKLLSLKFSKYGCLFYRKDAPPGSCPAIVEGDKLLHEHKNSIAEQFSIGPVVDTAFWSKGRGDMDIDRGPWTSAVDYVQALALREVAWIQKHATPRSPNDPLFVSHSQNNPAEHVSLLQRYLSVAPHLVPREENILGSFLWHSDLRTPNVFVDDTGHITSIIDWQSTWAGPLFLEGRHPHLLDYNDGKTLTDPIRFVGNTWEGDILPLRESLIRVQKKWDLLGHTARCPVNFSPEEIRKHHEDGEGWNEVQDFWDTVSGIMGRDGWTSHATYDQAISIYSQIQAKAASHSNDNV